jgi:hypothetical protein
VLIEDRCLAGTSLRVLSNESTRSEVVDAHLAVEDHRFDPAADELRRHRVTRRGDPDRRQLVDLADLDVSDPWPYRRQRPEQFPLDVKPLGRDGDDLAVHGGVDLGAPHSRRLIPHDQIVAVIGDRHVAFGIANEVLDDPLRLWIGGMAEVGPEPVVGGEAHVVRRRDHHPGHRPGLQTAHSVGEHVAWHTADHLEALGDQRHRRRRRLVTGEPHETEPAPRHHGAEHLDPARQVAPIDHQRLARHPHRRTPLMTRLGRPPLPLHLGNDATEVAWRPDIPGCPRRRQQPLRRDLRLRLSDPTLHELADDVGVLRHHSPNNTLLIEIAGLMSEHLALHRLRIDTAHHGRPPIRADAPERGNNIHLLPR